MEIKVGDRCKVIGKYSNMIGREGKVIEKYQDKYQKCEIVALHFYNGIHGLTIHFKIEDLEKITDGK